MHVTDVRFARSGDVHVAYRIVGDGPIDVVYAQGACTHLEVEWELPASRRYCERLADFARLILFDKRGMGMSERVPGATTLEERMDDIRAVMDAVGSERAAVMAESEGGPLAMLFAAAHPERTVALILQGAEVRERKDEDWPWGEATEEEFDADQTIAEIRAFLTGTREAPTADRMLATILFTDLVESTARAKELGDRRWRDLLEQHHAAVRRELGRYSGREVDTAGDGFFAIFDGPARAIRCACAIVNTLRPLGLQVRAGLHTGRSR